MPLIVDTDVKAGDLLQVMRPLFMGLSGIVQERGIVRVEEVDNLGHYRFRTELGSFIITPKWIQEGHAIKVNSNKEQDVGLIIEEATQATKQEAPVNGSLYLEELVAAYSAAEAQTAPSVRRALVDGLNQRYRSKPYRDMIKRLMSEGRIDKSVVNAMEDELRRHRFNSRTPHAKAYRYNWL